MQQTLYLMLGYPGAGKTTTAKILCDITNSVHIWADHERRLKYSSPTYSHAENIELYETLDRIAEDKLREGKSVVYDTNFSFHKDRLKLSELADKYHVRTVIIWVTTPRALAKQRATKDSHSQSTRVLGDMYESDFERISEKIEPPHHDEHFINIDGTQVTKEYVTEQLAHNQTSLENA